MASIQKRTKKDGTVSYRVEVRLKGFPSQRATFQRLTDAKRWVQDTESAIREGRYFKTAQARKHTLGELVDRYIGEVLPTKPKAGDRKTQLKWFKSEIGPYTLADITASKITECRKKLESEPNKRGDLRSPATVNRYLAALSHAFTVAVNEWGWLDDSPMRKVSRPTEPRGRVRFLSDDVTNPSGEKIPGERTRLLEACEASNNPYLYPVVVLALSTGMRRNEIMGLRWPDVDLNAGRLVLHETKNGERRGVPLVGKALNLLREHSKVRRLDTDLLFPSKVKPQKPMDLRATWLSAVAKARIEDFHFHDLRHTAASYLAMNGASLAEIAEILGHKTLQMVKRYAHLSQEHTAGVVTRMNERIFGG
jgi:integrase